MNTEPLSLPFSFTARCLVQKRVPFRLDQAMGSTMWKRCCLPDPGDEGAGRASAVLGQETELSKAGSPGREVFANLKRKWTVQRNMSEDGI